MAHKGLNRFMNAKASQTIQTLHTRNCLMNASIDPYTQPQHKLAKQDIGPQWWKRGHKGVKGASAQGVGSFQASQASCIYH